METAPGIGAERVLGGVSGAVLNLPREGVPVIATGRYAITDQATYP